MKTEHKIFTLILAITFLKCSNSESVAVQIEKGSSENDTFVATKEWQVIKEGQSIPSGLHVRLNLKTGVREAKLIDESEKKNNKDNKNTELNIIQNDENHNIIQNDESAKNMKDDNVLSQNLKEAIKKANENLDKNEWMKEKTEEHIKDTYKSYKQLKKDYAEMRSNFKTDMEIITELIKEFNNTKDYESHSNIINLLNDLNYLVHQFDNALWFIDSRGLNSVILPMVVNQTYSPYRIVSLRLLGALTQNNPKAQIKVYENNFGSYICNILLQSTDSDELSSAVYAFGSLLRKFPLAQKEILSQSGTKALISVLQKDIDLKVKAKVLSLISDLIIDKEYVIQSIQSNTVDSDKINQYYEVDLKTWLIENEYCSVVLEFITKGYLDIVRKPDLAEDLIEAMNNTYISCQKLWSENYNFIKILKSVEVNFRSSGDEYQNELSEKLENLILNINSNYEINKKKDEL